MPFSMEKLLTLLLFWEVFSTVHGYPNGNINTACNSMLPVHGNSVTQTSPPPYVISISNTSFVPGNEIIVSLLAINGSSFKGFLLQAQEVGGSVAIGRFRVLSPNTQALTCNNIQNSALSHTNKEDKQNVTAIWIAPSGTEDVVFRATVVQEFTVFWTHIQSQILMSSNTSFVSALPTFPQSTTLSPATISTEDGCGTQKFCFSGPAGCSPDAPNCYFMSSKALGNNAFTFEMSGPSDGYVAIGFSDDTIMGNDDVYICGKNAGNDIEVQHAFTTGRTTPIPKPLGKVDILTTSFNNGIIRCSFTSRNPISTQARSTDSLYYIFLTYGPSLDGQIRKHPRRPFITNQKVNISSFEALGGTSSTPLIIKVHGALMLTAWMTTGSIGMIFARYLKKSMKKHLWGKDIWFQIHFLLMMLTVVATATAFILAFVAAQGWNSGAGIHAVIGCIVMALSFLQPMIAFFRPTPQHKRRFIFNWFHMLNALIIKVLAVSAIFLGLQLLSNSPNHWMVKTMGGFVGWEALAAIILDINLWLKKKDTYEDSQVKVQSEILLLLIYLCGNVTFLTMLLIGIGSS